MDIIVCIKRVPEVAEIDLQVDQTGKSIKEEGLVFGVNDWDNYAVEEAVRIKEKHGGKVTAITVGSAESEEVIRRALALGADEAVMVTDPQADGSDAYAIAKVLAAAIKEIPYDIILTGVLADDDGCAQVGVTLAELLGIPHATLVTAIEIEEKQVKIKRELEGGMEEELVVATPALFTIQSGINEPRYVSIMGIRKVAKKEVATRDLGTLGLSPNQVGPAGSFTTVERIFPPPVGEGAQILEGSSDEVATKVMDVFQKGGVI
ncbi:MAG: electron transfer flavoprotein subunit beta/FixA family protein [Deltaproteobacteria bacterium]|nr:electron transfer flavoprotein subunit beta/FixA family protein [Deltaproteobacteria bacterium]